MSNAIVWLSSYPKSGSTWFRIVLSQLLNTSHTGHYIDDIDTILGSAMPVSRGWMNRVLGFDSLLLSEQEIEQVRPKVYEWYARQLTRTVYMKTHDAYTYVDEQNPLIPSQGCLGALYFVRNPLDVAISLAHHAKCPLDWSIQMMGNEQFRIPLAAQRDKQIRQRLLSWSGHVKSWKSPPNIPVMVVRYEDMFYEPVNTFSKAMSFLNLSYSLDDIKNAVELGSFDRLQPYEKKGGFQEKSPQSAAFFRPGGVGDWKHTLSDKQIARVIADHHDMMALYGYLNDTSQPVINVRDALSLCE